jgi:hypothetical protein
MLQQMVLLWLHWTSWVQPLQLLLLLQLPCKQLSYSQTQQRYRAQELVSKETALLLLLLLWTLLISARSLLLLSLLLRKPSSSMAQRRALAPTWRSTSAAVMSMQPPARSWTLLQLLSLSKQQSCSIAH